MKKLTSSWKSSIRKGSFNRRDSQFRHWVTPDGNAGASGDSGFKAEADRYHLYISLACPWAHRAMIFRKLKGLEKLISVSVVHPDMFEHGWTFEHNAQSEREYQTTGDTLYQREYLRELYTSCSPDYTANITVPVLWDKLRQTIVSNESSEIIRMLNSAFNDITGNDLDLYPTHLREEIDKINEPIYHSINNGVYKTGFATSQQAYTENSVALFKTLDELDLLLSRQRYLVGDQISEADWRLFTTLIRFDAVYHTHFKCNTRLIKEYPALYQYMLELYQQPGIGETVNIKHIMRHYYASHRSLNPYGIVPLGHQQDWETPHKRDQLPTQVSS